MKYIDFYKKLNLNTNEEIFNYIINNLKDTIKTYDFYVAWQKIVNNINNIEISLNIMNTLIGKSNIEESLRNLIKDYPEIVPVIPILIASREKILKIVTTNGDIEYHFTKKIKYSNTEIDNIVLFCKECGLLKILSDKNIKNLVDYCFGVEVGLDTNARKNRSGTNMENLIEIYLQSICEKYNYMYISQATANRIRENFGVIIPVDKSDRHFDFAINTNDKIYLIEVNYYSGGGSKLKSVAGEFKTLYELMKPENKVGFIWITDGKGWETAKRPLEETFNFTDFVMNIKLIEDGLLENIISNDL